MDTAFQADAFQNDAFQISGVVPPTAEGGGPGKFGKPRLRAKPPEPEKENEDWIVLIL